MSCKSSFAPLFCDAFYVAWNELGGVELNQ